MLYFPLDSPSFLLHVLGFVLTAVISLVVARWVARKGDDDAARAMVALLLTHVAMAVLFLGQMVFPSPIVGHTLARAGYGLILASPVLWFLFAVHYTGHEHWLTTPVNALLAASAVAPFALALTNPLHHLLVAGRVTLTEPFLYRRAVFTDLNYPFFFLVSLYVLVGLALLVRLSVFSRRSSRWQTVGLLVGVLVVQGTAVFSASGAAPIRNFPYGVYGAGVFGVIVAASLYRTRLFAVAPLARDSLFESLDDAVVVVDTDRRLVDYNDRALAVFPALEGAVGRSLDDVCPALVGSDDWSPDVAGLADAASGPSLAAAADPGGPGDTAVAAVDDDAESPFVGSVRRSVDGVTRSFNVTTSTIERGGVRRGYGLVVSDISDLVAYSRELERKTERLEQFASVLSHDLRNPVSVALGRIELEREAGDSEHLQKATDAIDRIEATIDDLLTLAQSGDAVTDPAPVSLRTVAGDAWSTADTGDATLTVDLGADVRVLAERSRLRTLFENCFRNAADHADGSVTVTVGPLDADEEGDAGFFVADDGPGIPESERETVFEYGYSTADGGTGFGLAIVRSVAEAHGWTVVAAECDDGARFEVRGVTRPDDESDTAATGDEWPTDCDDSAARSGSVSSGVSTDGG